jgi:hypothetical protein
MTDGLVLPPGAGRMVLGAGMTLKVGADQSGAWSAFEAEVTPGFDVGAHLHHNAERTVLHPRRGARPARLRAAGQDGG